MGFLDDAGLAHLWARAKSIFAQTATYDPAGKRAQVATEAELTAHAADAARHVTAAERTAWNGKEGAIKDAAAKSALADGDALPLIDSAAGSATKRITWANVTAAIRAKLDGVYAAVSHTHAWSAITGRPSSFTPAAHAASHRTGGADALSAADVGALPLAGGAMQGMLDLNGNSLVGADLVQVKFGNGQFCHLTSELREGTGYGRGVALKGRMIFGPGDTDLIFTGVGEPYKPNDAANKQYVDSKTLVFTGKTVAVSAWVANSTYSAQGYGFRAAVACAGVTASHRPDVAFGAADAVGGNFAPIVESYAGGVYLYCKTKPTATVTIPSIVCIKGA